MQTIAKEIQHVLDNVRADYYYYAATALERKRPVDVIKKYYRGSQLLMRNLRSAIKTAKKYDL